MDSKTELIVLSRIKYNDNSYIANVYTRDYGRKAVIIRIPKTQKNSHSTRLFFPLNVLEAEIAIKNTRNIHNVKNATQLLPIHTILTDIHKNTIGQFIAELLTKTIKEEEPNEQLYVFLKSTILSLESSTINIASFHVVFMKELAKFIGFALTPNDNSELKFFNLRDANYTSVFTNENESLGQNETILLERLIAVDFSDLSDMNFSVIERRILLDTLLNYYFFHIDDFQKPNSLDVLRSVFSNT